MFGSNDQKDNTQQAVVAADPGYIGSLESPVDSTDSSATSDLMGVPTPPVASSANPLSPTTDAPVPDLVAIKQQALQQLSPLVGHLDQTPEEKFRTTMMMIQASDNQELLPKAYEAANQIQDEKVKAQALLDVINEINYFTQHK